MFMYLYGVVIKMTRSISLSPDQLKEKSVYLRVTGTQASKIELEAPLKKALQERGVSVVDNADDARFYLHINTLFADNLKEAARLDVALFWRGCRRSNIHGESQWR